MVEEVKMSDISEPDDASSSVDDPERAGKYFVVVVIVVGMRWVDKGTDVVVTMAGDSVLVRLAAPRSPFSLETSGDGGVVGIFVGGTE